MARHRFHAAVGATCNVGFLLFGAVWLTAFMSAGSVRANVVVDVNNALLNIIQNTSAPLVDGPPEVAREIALIDGAMFDAVNAASGSPYPPIAYTGGPVSGAYRQCGGVAGRAHRDEQPLWPVVALSTVRGRNGRQLFTLRSRATRMPWSGQPSPR